MVFLSLFIGLPVVHIGGERAIKKYLRLLTYMFAEAVYNLHN